MINRVLIRIKVLQLFFSYQLTLEDNPDRNIFKELATCFDNCYLLYFHLLKLPLDLAYLHLRQADDARHNGLERPDLSVETHDRFFENSVLEDLRNNTMFQSYCEKHPEVSWNDDALFLKLLLDRVRQSEVYQQYMALPLVNRVRDGRFLRDLMRDVLLVDPEVLANLENKHSLWTEDDVDLIGQFVIKTLRRVESSDARAIMPMFRNRDDAHFGELLLRASIDDMQYNSDFIDDLIDAKRWGADRVARMDRIILCQAIAEAVHFMSIPTTVTLNEYIELAKNFSTDNSGMFVNGVLHTALHRLRADGVINKP